MKFDQAARELAGYQPEAMGPTVTIGKYVYRLGEVLRLSKTSPLRYIQTKDLYKNQHIWRERRALETDPILGVWSDGKPYLLLGDHKVTAAMRKGLRVVQCRMLDEEVVLTSLVSVADADPE